MRVSTCMSSTRVIPRHELTSLYHESNFSPFLLVRHAPKNKRLAFQGCSISTCAHASLVHRYLMNIDTSKVPIIN